MRVLLTTDTLGGVWTFNQELAGGLLARGHCVLLVSVGPPPIRSQLAWAAATSSRHGQSFQFESALAPLEWMQENGKAYEGAANLLLRRADRFKPDVLHSSQFCFGCLPVDAPRVVTAHSDVLSWAAACRPGGIARCDWLDRYRSLVEAGLESAAAVVAPTQWMLDELHRHFTVCGPCRVILNGRTLRVSGSTEGRTMQAVSVGRLWDEAKHLAMLMRVKAPIPLLVAGECRHEETGTDEDVQSKHVTVLGLLEQDELLSLFGRSAVYVAPSLYEPFGLAPLEAALCGCVLLLHDIASFREVWGEAALYFKDADSLKRQLALLKDDAALLSSFRRRSSMRAGRLTAARMTEAYLDLYRELTSPSSGRHEALSRTGSLAHG